jgi:DNA repair exonuclease SbcCD nuclease subunit
LFSDVLLDRPYEWAPPAVADARRTAAREALVELLATARAQDVNVIACAGDLFDRRTVRPGTMRWLIAALRSAGRVLIAPGNRDFVGPLGGYSRHEWPDNVTVFGTDRFVAVEVAEGVTIWGAAHTEAHRPRSFFEGFKVDREGVNLALFHGSERSGADRQPGIEPCAPFDAAAIQAVGFDHALVGHYQQPHFGLRYTYPGALVAHDFHNGAAGGAVLVTLAEDGTLSREYLEIPSTGLHDVGVDLTGAKSARDVLKRAKVSLGERRGVIRLRFTGRVPLNVVLQREDFLGLTSSHDNLLLDWNAEIDVDLDHLAEEQTVRGQFVRDVLAAGQLTNDRRQRVLLIGLRALGGSSALEGPR